MTGIIMLHGLPCSGKSTLAGLLKDSFPHLVILKTVDFRSLGNSSPDAFDESIVKTQLAKDETYRQLVDSARKVITEQKIALLDATFHKKYRRDWVFKLAEELNSKLAIISLSCDETTTFKRLKQREYETSNDSFLKSEKAFKIMQSQQDLLTETGNIKKIENTYQLDEVLIWLKNILL